MAVFNSFADNQVLSVNTHKEGETANHIRAPIGIYRYLI